MNESLEPQFFDRNVGAYLTALSSKSPAPGGGSAAGLAGAMGCALGSMVCNLTLSHASDDSLEQLRDTFLELEDSILQQAIADELAFTAYRDAAALPRSTPEEKSARRTALEHALVQAADVPLEMSIRGLEAVSELKTAALVGTTHALGDLATGGYLLQSMILGCLENIEANAVLMKDAKNRERFEHAAVSVRADLENGLAGLGDAIRTRRVP